MSNSKKTKPANDKKGKKKSNDKNIVWIAGAISLFLIIAITTITILIIFGTGGGPKPGNFVTSDYVGRNYYEVRDELKASGIIAKEIPKYNPSIPKDTIIYQSVSKNKQLKEGYTIEFDVSQGVDIKQVPNLRDVEYREAEVTLKGLKLNIVFVDEFSDTVSFNKVTRTMPESGSDIQAGTEIALYRSKGPELKMIKVPDLIGKTVSEARTELEKIGLKLGTASPSSSGTAKVKSQNPIVGTDLRQDMAVDLTTIQVITMITKSYSIVLGNPGSYGTTIQVKVIVTPSDTGTASVIMDESRARSTFPLNINIQIPSGGSTRVVTELDGNQIYNVVLNSN